MAKKKPPEVKRTRSVPLAEHVAAHPLRLAAFAVPVLDKHHPDASAEEIADAMGGHVSFGGDIYFDEEDEY